MSGLVSLSDIKDDIASIDVLVSHISSLPPNTILTNGLRNNATRLAMRNYRHLMDYMTTIEKKCRTPEELKAVLDAVSDDVTTCLSKIRLILSTIVTEDKN